MPDQYESVRNIPFPVLADALGIDIKRFRRSRDEWAGYCPVHESKSNNNCFHYADSGVYHCFSCHAKGKGPLDLTMALTGVKIQEAAALLAPYTTTAPLKEKSSKQETTGATNEVNELKPYTGKYHKFKVPCPWLEARVCTARWAWRGAGKVDPTTIDGEPYLVNGRWAPWHLGGELDRKCHCS